MSLRVVVLGLSLPCSRDTGRATTFHTLLKAFAARGHEILVLERGGSWTEANCEPVEMEYGDRAFYDSMEALAGFREAIVAADAVIVGPCMPDAVRISAYVHAHAGGITAFYDIDAAETLAALDRGDCAYLDAEQIPAFELYLALSGGPALAILEHRYGAPVARALYGAVDPEICAPPARRPLYDLGYLGPITADRQRLIEKLLLEPARRLPRARFIVAGPKPHENIALPANVAWMEHLPSAARPDFFANCRFTLHLTRGDMTALPHGSIVHLFEAAACGSLIISDARKGPDVFFTPGAEILLADSGERIISLLTRIDEARRRTIAAAARDRILAGHIAALRAEELEQLLLAARTNLPLARSSSVPAFRLSRGADGNAW